MIRPLLSVLLVLIFSLGITPDLSAQCTYTTIKDGNFDDPTVYLVSGSGCIQGSLPTSTSTIVINHQITLNQDLVLEDAGRSTGSLTINSTGSLLQDATPRTLTVSRASLTVASSTSRSAIKLQVSVLDISFTSATVGANSTLSITCNLLLGNQGGLALSTNSLLNVLGNVNVSNGNGTITGAPAGTPPAGIRVAGNFTGVNGGTSNVYSALGIISCVQNNPAAGCSATGAVQPAPLSNDPTCFSVLPVTLTKFSASRQGQSVVLNWATAMEKDNAYFEVQRSANKQHFASLGKVAGHGTTASGAAYTFLDQAPLADLAYYRLRQVDADGSEHFSSVVAIAGANNLEAQFYPNPSSTTVTLPTTGGQVHYRIYSPTGQTLTTGAAPGATEVDIQQVPTGLYFLEISAGSKRHVQRFVRQ